MNKVLTEDIIPSLKEKVPKLYTGYGTNTDGAVTQGFIDTKLNSTKVVLGASAQGLIGPTVCVGNSSYTGASNTVAVGPSARTSTSNSVSVGYGSVVSSGAGVAIGAGATVLNVGSATGDSIALGSGSSATRGGELNIGASTGKGYEGSNTRVLSGVHAGVYNEDAVNLKQMNDAINAAVGDINTILEHYDTGAGV